jgi:hypothetical protein
MTPKTCSVCRKQSKHKHIPCFCIILPGLGPELDTRSGHGDHRSVQVCPYCGYCAGDISRAILGASTIVTSHAYQDQLKSTEYPARANEFLCWGMILASSGDFATAGWAGLHAAWACDDEVIDQVDSVIRRVCTPAQVIQLTLSEMLRCATLGWLDLRHVMKDRNNKWALAAARMCRRSAAELFQRATDSGQKITPEASGEEVIVVDLLRRSGRLEDALARCQSDLAKHPEPKVRKILAYEYFLIRKRDIGRHRLDEAMKEAS